MQKRFVYGAGVLLLVILVALVVWQGSFSFGDYAPASAEQTYTLWAVSTLIFLLTVTLAFMLVRNFVKLYVERHSNREGSRIRTKLVLGALALSCVPVFFLVVFSVYVLNRSLDKWFSRPAENIRLNLMTVADGIQKQHRDKLDAQARWIASLPQVRDPRPGALGTLCQENSIVEVRWLRGAGNVRLCAGGAAGGVPVTVRAPAPDGAQISVTSALPLDLAAIHAVITREIHDYEQLRMNKKITRLNYVQLLALITLFILFFAVWIALFLAKQISTPIAALLGAAQEVRRGNLAHRVQTGANDELFSLVRAFNDMTEGLEAGRKELEDRRRFTEAILESIPTGVISLGPDGAIQRVNRALRGIFSEEQVARAGRLEDLFASEDVAELRYLMNRARRMGTAGSQLELRTPQRVLHLSATVAALEDRATTGFVLVLEDTSDMLRAQKAAAWHEVARRIAHEIKNPLTPIALCSERIARQLDRGPGLENARVLRECSATISTEVESLKTLVDEFSQFARFPAAQPVISDLNEVIESALAVFTGRLDGIEVIRHLDRDLPPISIDREQFKRLVVNLVDNAAEAMQQSLVRRLLIRTSSPAPETVELIIADTGCGISPEDKEKLFLPHFSTKGRGTGLGLAIVQHIVSDHNAQIRVEDNVPAGARFIIELPAAASIEASVA